MRRSAIIGAGTVLWGLLFSAGQASAETLDYVIEIKNHVPASYSLDIPVLYPGTLSLDATWNCSRILTFKLTSPDRSADRVRRSGPSPQRLDIAVNDTDLKAGQYFRLDISSLPAGGEGEGILRIHLPDSPHEIRRKELAALPPEPELPEPEWWAVPVSPPPGSSKALDGLYREVETFRKRVVISPLELAPDPCRWQTELLQHLSGIRDTLAGGGKPPDDATLRFYRKVSLAIRQVEELKDSDDPILAGPPPRDRKDRNMWLRMRRNRVRPIEHQLDVLMDMPEDGYVPELEGEEWPPRLMSCLMACERNFEERGRFGKEQGVNQELAEETWPFIIQAARMLEALDRVMVPKRIKLN
jgi:hypothetical protein